VTPTEEEELAHLSEQIRLIDSQLGSNPSGREALQKAGIALMLAFLQGRRHEVDELYSGIDAELTEAQRAHLRHLGIDPKD
jgi:hypothetical protein